MSQNAGRRLYVLWADDISKGPNDKVNLIGIYGTEMRLPEPTTISQLYAFVEISTPLSRPFKTISLSVRATKETSGTDEEPQKSDKEILVDFNVPATALGQVLEAAEQGDLDGIHPEGTSVRTAMRIGLPISGVKVIDHRFLSVRAETEEGPMVSEVLLMKVAQPARTDAKQE
ncbi:hypothetical protein [Burkholderia ubonensis]|uniref:hypothetical protein n=1 Tax=Burkholderia ubonensis TaxID=101571 RepID=UPI0012FC1A8C|nr:hypothetical protein [Burkholderia ubonensis]